MQVSVKRPIVTKPPSLSQRTARALAQLGEILQRSDTKLLTAALVETAVGEMERNQAFARSVQLLYDALAATAKPTHPKPAARPRKELIPIVEAGEIVLDRIDRPDAYILQRLYGNEQLRDALDGYTLASLKEMAAEVTARNPGTRPFSLRTKASIIDYIVARLTETRQ